ncbi:MAG TPA: DsbA family protein [Candidatus Paceibacterota bacterium]
MKKYKDFFTPVAILAAGVMVSLSILTVGGVDILKQGLPAQAGAGSEAEEEELRPQVTKDDYVRGNPDAPITIVEFSDLECPFCKRFHSELRQALADYGDQVRWVYKHFPLDALHPKADKEAEAVECAGELGGDEKFWAYMDRIFEVTPSNNGLDLALLPQIAKDLGLDQKAFENCLSSGKYAEKVEKQYQEGVRLGINGTPGSFVNATPVQGAIPYENLKAIIEAEIQKL